MLFKNLLFIFVFLSFSNLFCENKLINLTPIHQPNENFDIDQEDSYSLETFKELIEKKNAEDQPYILARVISGQPNRPYVHYFDAHNFLKDNFVNYPNVERFNQLNYKYQDQDRNIIKNPLNREEVRDIQFLQIEHLKDPDFKYLFSLDNLKSNNNYFIDYLVGNLNNITQGPFNRLQLHLPDPNAVAPAAMPAAAPVAAPAPAPAAAVPPAPAPAAPIAAAPIVGLINPPPVINVNQKDLDFNAQLNQIRNIASKLIALKQKKQAAANKQRFNANIAKLRRQLLRLNLSIVDSNNRNILMRNPRLILILCDLPKNLARTLATATDNAGKTVKQYLINSPIAKNRPNLFIRLAKILNRCAKVKFNKQDLNRLKARIGQKKWLLISKAIG